MDKKLEWHVENVYGSFYYGTVNKMKGDIATAG